MSQNKSVSPVRYAIKHDSYVSRLPQSAVIELASYFCQPRKIKPSLVKPTSYNMHTFFSFINLPLFVARGNNQLIANQLLLDIS